MCSAWEVKDRKLTHARNSDFTNFSNYYIYTIIPRLICSFSDDVASNNFEFLKQTFKVSGHYQNFFWNAVTIKPFMQRSDPISYKGGLVRRFFACLAVVAWHSADIIKTKNKNRTCSLQSQMGKETPSQPTFIWYWIWSLHKWINIIVTAFQKIFW